MYHARFSESMHKRERGFMGIEGRERSEDRHLACLGRRASSLPCLQDNRIDRLEACRPRQPKAIFHMKTPLEAPPEQVKAETGVKEIPKTGSAPIIDTSKMSAGKAAALELAEASRDPLDERGSFASNLFIGKFGFERIFPYPAQSEEDHAKGEAFLTELKNYLRDHVDADEIDRTGEIPQKNIEELFAMGAFGVKIPQQYEGLGLSQVNYGRAAMLLGSWDANLTALISAHQSIGVPQPLLLFGTRSEIG